jgi:hypothetical protein
VDFGQELVALELGSGPIHMDDLTRGLLVACEAKARWKPSGFQGFALKQASKRTAPPRSGIATVDEIKTCPQPGGRPLFVQILPHQRLKCHQINHINRS